jgi:hypothetical protein
MGGHAIMAATGKSKPCVWRWQERFMAEGVAGLLRDKTRPPGIAPLDAKVVDNLVKLTLEPPVHEATHWTVRAMAKAVCGSAPPSNCSMIASGITGCLRRAI